MHDVAAALRVRLAVISSFQRNGDRVRITARVVDVVAAKRSPTPRSAAAWTRSSLRDQVAAQFAGELGAATPGPGLAQPRDGESRAYRAVMEG
jgi:TolB-like protein